MKKKIILYTMISVFVLILVGCEYDNYDPPTSFLTGTVTYNGNAVGVRSGATQLELWQHGYQLFEKIPVHIAQDGTFSARVYDGNYLLVRLKGAPWETTTDSIPVTVIGNTTIDVPVTPFYTIVNPVFTLNGNVITSTCNLTKVGTYDITSLTLYVGANSIVDQNYNSQNNVLSASALTDLSTPKTNTVTLSEVNAARDFVYVRLGVLSKGSSERYYTQVQKIMLP